MKVRIVDAILIGTVNGWTIHIRWRDWSGPCSCALPLPLPTHIIKPAKPRKPKR